MTSTCQRSLLDAEDGAALVAHPDVVLRSGEPFTCSCGYLTAVRMTTLTVSWPTPHEEPMTTWCVRCGDVARWSPSPSSSQEETQQ